MKKQIAYTIFLIGINFLSCSKGVYKTFETGVEIVSENGIIIKLDVISDGIIQVKATCNDKFSETPSLVAIMNGDKTVKWELEEAKDEIVLKTSLMSAKVSLKTGSVSFLDADGNVIINEPAYGGKTFIRVEDNGNIGFSIQQKWESPGTEAIYGLGQHQAHEMNYKGKNEELFQYNTKVSVPFIISTKNYGVLWDNYSFSRYGDSRPYEQINQFELYNNAGKKGGLTATYVDDLKSENVFIVRDENSIDYENLETIKNFPEGFEFNKSKITWEGHLVPMESGKYNFLLYYAGYTKIWINGNLMADRWRTAWNPSVAKFPFDMVKGEKYAIKLEWYPDGGKSYIGLKALSPVDPVEQNNISFYSEMGDEINYYFVKGNSLDEVIKGYRYLTGKAQVMPKWAMGFWQSRERYKTQDELLNVLKEFRKRQIPIDNIVQDWFFWEEDQWGSQKFDLKRFPDPQKMVNEVHENNARIMISVWPKYYITTDHYKRFNDKGWIYKLAVNDSIRDWVGDGHIGSFYDAYNPDARQLFWEQMRDNLYNLGIDAWWLDATEPDILSNASVEYRKALMDPTYLGSATKYFNAFALMNAKGIYEGQRKDGKGERVFILTRSGFAGMQRYGTVTWSGDIGTVWEDMKAQIPAGINFSMSGLPYWTMDIGGFCVEKRFENAKEGSEDLNEWRELNTRWYQFGTFVPLFRAHGQFPFREIWNIAPENHKAYQSMLYYNKLRYRLMPYIYSMTGAVYHNDFTMMRGLAMDFPHDKEVFDIDDQYMFGKQIMVCPVYKYKERNRNVYLPSGKGWYELHTGKYYTGGQTTNVNAPYEHIPLFVPEGSIIPFGPAIEYTSQKTNEPYTIVVFTGMDGEFLLYDDEGVNYNYEKGHFATIKINYSEENQSLVLGKRNGSFEGLDEKIRFRVIWVSKEQPFIFSFNGLNEGRVYEYTGDELVIER